MNRHLSKFHLLAKIALFVIFATKFLDHVYTHALKQSEYRKKSNKSFLQVVGRAVIGACLR